MDDFFRKNKRRLFDLTILSGAILFCFLFFRYLFPILLPFFVGWLLSLLFCPLADRLQRRGVPRWISAWLCLFLLFGVIGLFGALIGNRIEAQARSFFTVLPHYIESIQAAMDNIWAKLESLRQALPGSIQPYLEKVQSSLSSILLSLVQSGSSSLTGVPSFLLGLIVALFSAYFFTKDRDKIYALANAHIAPLLGESLNRTRKELKYSLWGYVKTQLILMIYTFGICIIGLMVLRSPYALLLSVIIAIIDALPFFGSGFILWPGAVIHLILGDAKLCIGYLVIYAAVQIMRQIMQPKILGTQIGLHPLLTLFSMYFGFKCIGFWGLILGPVVAVLLRAYFQTREKERHSSPPAAEETTHQQTK